VGVGLDRKLRAQIVRASAPLAGLAAETFTPLAWTSADPTVLYLHGGSYVVGSPSTHRELIALLAVAAGARAVAIAYRKAPEHPFPAAVDDAEAAYRALLAINPPPSCLFVAGDSAGGGLALAVALRARESGLPLPCALLLLSPWTDLECAGESIGSNADFDYVTAAALKRGVRDYLQGADARHPLASAIHADLRGLPPLFIETGDAELLLSDNQALAARAARAGVPVVHHVEPDMVHVFPAFCRVLPGPGQAALDRLGAFARQQAADAARSADVATLRTAP
jgi:acetyl esterase/lipase